MKKIFVQVEIPTDYKWVAVQPWGEIMAFKHKPTLLTVTEDGIKLSPFWKMQANELVISNKGVPANESAEKTLQRIK